MSICLLLGFSQESHQHGFWGIWAQRVLVTDNRLPFHISAHLLWSRALFKLQGVLLSSAFVYVHYCPGSFKDRKEGFYDRPFSNLIPWFWSLKSSWLQTVVFLSTIVMKRRAKNTSGKLCSSESKHSSSGLSWGKLCHQGASSQAAIKPPLPRRQAIQLLMCMLLLAGICENLRGQDIE